MKLSMFEGLLVNVLILLASLLALNKASDLTISNSIKVAAITGFGKTTVGFILVAFATSLPELLVSIFSVISPESIGIAIGNVLGSNIVNICLILGICFLLITLRNSKNVTILPVMAKEEIGSLYFGLFVASIIPLTLLYIGYASRFMGIILLAIFVFYIYQLSKIKIAKEEGSLGKERQKLRKYTFLTFLGAAAVVISSYFIVDSASYIAVDVGIPRVVIGATIVAFGTSIPELATSINATKKGHLDLALGNIVGSCFINITCILGITLAASTLMVNMAAFSHLAMFSLITNLFLWYFLSSEKISWREGTVLLFMYFMFLTISFGGYQT
jgi:cation:H+ antiporter